MSDFPKFPSIERFDNLRCFITEKIDGTNGLIEVSCQGVKFGSRNKWLSNGDDNFGFYAYFSQYVDDMVAWYHRNAPGYNWEPVRIYGEWFGKGIQRGYDLKERKFMPFSYGLAEDIEGVFAPNIVLPEFLYQGKFSREVLNNCMNSLKEEGSQVVPGYMKPEGVVVYFPDYEFSLKETFDGPKWKETYTVDRSRFRDIPRACASCGRGMFIDRDEKDHNPEFSEDYYKKNGYHAICLKNKECPAHGKYV